MTQFLRSLRPQLSFCYDEMKPKTIHSTQNEKSEAKTDLSAISYDLWREGEIYAI